MPVLWQKVRYGEVSKMYAWWMSRGFIPLIIFVFIAVIVSPSAVPILEEDISANPSPASDPSTKHLSTTPLIPRTPTMHHIPAGAHVTVAHGWIITRRAITSIIPVQTMASVLESFFVEALQRLAMSGLQNRPHPGDAFGLSIGAVNLALRAVNPANYLTWEVCEIVVAQLLNDAQMGFPGQFRSTWYHPASGTLLYVGVGVLQRVVAGPEGERT